MLPQIPPWVLPLPQVYVNDLNTDLSHSNQCLNAFMCMLACTFVHFSKSWDLLHFHFQTFKSFKSDLENIVLNYKKKNVILSELMSILLAIQATMSLLFCKLRKMRAMFSGGERCCCRTDWEKPKSSKIVPSDWIMTNSFKSEEIPRSV